MYEYATLVLNSEYGTTGLELLNKFAAKGWVVVGSPYVINDRAYVLVSRPKEF